MVGYHGHVIACDLKSTQLCFCNPVACSADLGSTAAWLRPLAQRAPVVCLEQPQGSQAQVAADLANQGANVYLLMGYVPSSPSIRLCRHACEDMNSEGAP